MMRVRNIPVAAELPERQLVADFFDIPKSEIVVEAQPDTFSIYIKDNEIAQEKYKAITPFGNSNIPKRWDFSERLLVIWNGTKVQPV